MPRSSQLSLEGHSALLNLDIKSVGQSLVVALHPSEGRHKGLPPTSGNHVYIQHAVLLYSSRNFSFKVSRSIKALG